MPLAYNTDLTKAERQQFTERLIKLHTILGEDTSTEYKHQVWTQQTDYGFFKRLTTGHSCGTAACAMGHALLHHDQFPGLAVKDQTEIRDMVKEFSQKRANAIQPYVPGAGAYTYFGPKSFNYIFNPNAYDMAPERVTRQMAMDRIEQYIREVLGCQLIEA